MSLKYHFFSFGKKQQQNKSTSWDLIQVNYPCSENFSIIVHTIKTTYYMNDIVPLFHLILNIQHNKAHTLHFALCQIKSPKKKSKKVIRTTRLKLTSPALENINMWQLDGKLFWEKLRQTVSAAVLSLSGSELYVLMFDYFVCRWYTGLNSHTPSVQGSD